MRRADRCRRGLLAALLMAAIAPAAFAAPAATAATRGFAVAPVRAGEQLACRVTTAGLPDERQLQSMRSGLVAALELELALVDEGDRVAAARSVTFRLAFDLWEEVFSVADDGGERRFRSLAELQAHLARLPALPLLPLSALHDGARYRLRAALVVRPVARDERERVGDLIAGQAPGAPGRQDRQEASVSLGRLIRFFYQGGRDERDGQETASGWFRAGEVPHEAH
ncbi:MAG: hypothetical protein IPK64_00880 [bacterium]|nr:hypothetical protein [bacterium]